MNSRILNSQAKMELDNLILFMYSINEIESYKFSINKNLSIDSKYSIEFILNPNYDIRLLNTLENLFSYDVEILDDEERIIFTKY